MKLPLTAVIAWLVPFVRAVLALGDSGTGAISRGLANLAAIAAYWR